MTGAVAIDELISWPVAIHCPAKAKSVAYQQIAGGNPPAEQANRLTHQRSAQSKTRGFLLSEHGHEFCETAKP